MPTLPQPGKQPGIQLHRVLGEDQTLKPRPPGRILALDLGEVRIGVALSDPLRVTARALTTLASGGVGADLAAIGALVDRHEVSEIVVGHPLRLGGERGRAAEAAERFVGRLRRELRVPIHLWDERLTTRAAERAMLEMNASRRQRGAARDRVAAALILQGYLEFIRLGREADPEEDGGHVGA